MIDSRRFRELALALPEAQEQPHVDRPSFRVRGKIFAVLRAAEGRAVLKLPLDERAALVAEQPEVFEAVKGWSAQGWTFVWLEAVDPAELRELLQEAWRGVAPKRLGATLERPASA
jgi:hypothetical protein